MSPIHGSMAWVPPQLSRETIKLCAHHMGHKLSSMIFGPPQMQKYSPHCYSQQYADGYYICVWHKLAFCIIVKWKEEGIPCHLWKLVHSVPLAKKLKWGNFIAQSSFDVFGIHSHPSPGWLGPPWGCPSQHGGVGSSTLGRLCCVVGRGCVYYWCHGDLHLGLFHHTVTFLSWVFSKEPGF